MSRAAWWWAAGKRAIIVPPLPPIGGPPIIDPVADRDYYTGEVVDFLVNNSGGDAASWTVDVLPTGLDYQRDPKWLRIYGTVGTIVPPDVVKPADITFYPGQPFDFLVANQGGRAQTWSVSQLPSGLTYDDSDPYFLRIYGTVVDGVPVIFIPDTTANTTLTVGVPYTYQVIASNEPRSYAATGLPDGLSINIQTGLISGTPTTAAVYPASVTAANSFGISEAAIIVFTVNPAPAIDPPELTNPGDQTVTVGVPFSLKIDNTGGAVTDWTVRQDWLPDGLEITEQDPFYLTIAGTPTGPEAPYVQTPKRSIPVRGDRINLSNPLARGLIGYWPMLEGTGRKLYDYSGYGWDVTYTGTMTWGSGKLGPNVTLTGPNNNISAPPAHPVRSMTYISDATLLLWCQYQPSPDYNEQWNVRGDGLSLYFYLRPSQNYVRGYWRGDVQRYVTAVNADLPGHARCLGLVYTNSQGRLFVDGQFAAGPGAALTAGGNTENYLKLVSGPPLYQAMLYDRALSDEEMYNLYADTWALFR